MNNDNGIDNNYHNNNNNEDIGNNGHNHNYTDKVDIESKTYSNSDMELIKKDDNNTIKKFDIQIMGLLSDYFCLFCTSPKNIRNYNNNNKEGINEQTSYICNFPETFSKEITRIWQYVK
eukprot:Pgem_evm1s8177